MILKQAAMKVVYYNKTNMILVLLWKEVGLCIHKHLTNKAVYNISHYNSGRSVLVNIKSKEEAMKYMQKLHDEVLEDWTFTIDDWNDPSIADLKAQMKRGIDTIQQEICNKPGLKYIRKPS